MSARTDLAIELKKEGEKSSIFEEKIGNTSLIFTELKENNEFLKPKGKYATLKVGKIDLLPDFCDIEKGLNKALSLLLDFEWKNLLVVGLGNMEITCDNIGPVTAQKILATRHIAGENAEKIGLKNLKSIAVISPSVMGKTGIEASEIVSSVVKKIKPDAVIVIDALCSRNTENLFSVIQLCDSGIAPGSGVKNSRKELSQSTLGVPTVAIGVPTVVEAGVLAGELSGQQITAKTDLIVTPKEADLLSHRMSEALSSALNVFLQPNIEKEVILGLV